MEMPKQMEAGMAKQINQNYWETRKIFCRELFVTAPLRFQLRIILARCLKIDPQRAKRFILNMRGKSDNDIIQEIQKILEKKTTKPIPNSDEWIIKANQGNLGKIFQELNLKPDQFSGIENAKYLDIGSGQGHNTLATGNYFEFPKENIFGLDIKEYENVCLEQDQINIYDGFKCPFPDNHFDLITIYQVLHHVDELDKLITEIARILKPQGYLVIKEHHSDSSITKSLIELEHFLYDLRNKSRKTTSLNNGLNNLYSHNQWVQFFKDKSLDQVGLPVKIPNDPTKSFFAFFIKKTKIK